jgi:SAM-dependent methyltransferase
MEKREYERMFQAQNVHWWYRGMTAVTRALIEKYYHAGGGLRICDAGCGTGGALNLLSDYGRVTCFDRSPYALQLSRRLGDHPTALASVMETPFKNSSFDLVTSFDVLYFKDVDDLMALREFHRILTPQGRVILRVPAYDWLRGSHDISVSTGHRYSLRELRFKLDATDFRPGFMSYANSLLFPLIGLKRILEKWFDWGGDSDIAIDLKRLGSLFETILRMESILIRRHALPFGFSVVAVGEKG